VAAARLPVAAALCRFYRVFMNSMNWVGKSCVMAAQFDWDEAQQ